MNIIFSYLAVLLVFGLLSSNAFPVLSNSWFMLIFFGVLNIAVIGAHEYASKHNAETEEPKPDNKPRQNTPAPKEPDLSIARPENEGNKIAALWQGRYIRFYKDNDSSGIPVSLWMRDRYGNIIKKLGAPVSGLVYCELVFGGNCRAKAQIQFENNMITDYPVIWYRASGNRYMDYILAGDALTGTCNTYHHNGNLKKTLRLENGLPTGAVRAYYEDGGIMYSADYKSGRKEGSYSRYYSSGTVIETGSRIGGRLAGYVRTYSPSQVLSCEKYYANGSLMFTIFYDYRGLFIGQTYTEKFYASASDDEEIKSFRRLAAVNTLLSKQGMFLLDPQSNNFPRIRAICRFGSSGVLREFFCEEELICFVLDPARFGPFAENSSPAKPSKIIRYFNDKGRLVRFR